MAIALISFAIFSYTLCTYIIILYFIFGVFNKHVFIEKIQMVKMEFPLLEACLPAYSFVDIDTIMLVCTSVFDTFQTISCDVLSEYYS